MLIDLATSELEPNWANGVPPDVFAAVSIMRASAQGIADTGLNLFIAWDQRN